MRKKLLGGGGLVDSVLVVAYRTYHTHHTYKLTIPYRIYRIMPSPTDSPHLVESHMVSMYDKYASMVGNSQILSYALSPRPC